MMVCNFNSTHKPSYRFGQLIKLVNTQKHVSVSLTNLERGPLEREKINILKKWLSFLESAED